MKQQDTLYTWTLACYNAVLKPNVHFYCTFNGKISTVEPVLSGHPWEMAK